jgi:hypothetical protein
MCTAQEGRTCVSECLCICLLLSSKLSVSTVGKHSTAPVSTRVKLLSQIHLLAASLLLLNCRLLLHVRIVRSSTLGPDICYPEVFTWFSSLSSIKRVKLTFISYSGVAEFLDAREE